MARATREMENHRLWQLTLLGPRFLTTGSTDVECTSDNSCLGGERYRIDGKLARISILKHLKNNNTFEIRKIQYIYRGKVIFQLGKEPHRHKLKRHIFTTNNLRNLLYPLQNLNGIFWNVLNSVEKAL